jgi:uncharacterized protein
MNKISEPKPAWLWRIVQFPLTRLFVLGGIMVLAIGLSNGFRFMFAESPWMAIASAAGVATLALSIYYCFVRFIERRPATEIAFAGMGRELGTGLACGAALFTICVLILMIPGIYRIDGMNAWHFLIPGVAMALSSGVLEELLYRGALFRIVEESLGSWISLVVSSLVFGISHLLNPHGTITGALFISVEAGLLLAAAYMLTRRLWLGIGFHLAWNYTQCAVFSGIVSGDDSEPGLFKSTIEGPAALTGGSFGLESSVVAFLLCTATGVVLLMMAVRRGNSIPPFWKREA